MEKDEISKGLAEIDLADSCLIEVNDAGTSDENDTGLTQDRSLTVLPEQTTNFALESLRAYFIRQRNIDGANTILGHRWSNLVGQTWNLHFAKSQDQRNNLMISIARMTLQIRNIKRGQSEQVLLSPPQLLLTFQTIH